MNETADEVFNLRATFWGFNNNSSVTQPTGGRSSAGILAFCWVFLLGDENESKIITGKGQWPNDKTGMAKTHDGRCGTGVCGADGEINGTGIKGQTNTQKKEEKKRENNQTELYAMNDTPASRLLALRMNENYRHTHTRALVEINCRVFTKKWKHTHTSLTKKKKI